MGPVFKQTALRNLKLSNNFKKKEQKTSEAFVPVCFQGKLWMHNLNKVLVNLNCKQSCTAVIKFHPPQLEKIPEPGLHTMALWSSDRTNCWTGVADASDHSATLPKARMRNFKL